ncbi:MAG: GNAT family N-acetyltransferase [Candidatus Omnitrophica bacterium]|nr:GNAT family N-acetyltransferase [Candidatus Omnitrophota bacterium]
MRDEADHAATMTPRRGAIRVHQGVVPEAAVGLFQEVFAARKGRRADVRESFPLAFAPDARNACVVWSEGTRAAGGVILRLLDHPVCRIWLLGFLATAEDRRGQGIASALLDSAEGVARQAGARLGLLWTSQHAFYATRGWIPRDLFPAHVMARSGGDAGSGVTVAPDASAMRSFAGRRFPWRTAEDTGRLAAMTAHLHFGRLQAWRVDAQGRTVGYAVTGGETHVLELVVERQDVERPALAGLSQALGAAALTVHHGMAGGEAERQEDRLTMVKWHDQTFDAGRLLDLGLSPLDRI